MCVRRLMISCPHTPVPQVGPVLAVLAQKTAGRCDVLLYDSSYSVTRPPKPSSVWEACTGQSGQGLRACGHSRRMNCAGGGRHAEHAKHNQDLYAEKWLCTKGQGQDHMEDAPAVGGW